MCSCVECIGDQPKPYEFQREPRYVVFKIKDMLDYLSDEQMAAVEQIGQRIAKGRYEAGKPRFNAVVVEQDWPEFEPTWAAIEARMKTPNDLGNRLAATGRREGEDG